MFQKFIKYFDVKEQAMLNIESYKEFLDAFSGEQFGNGLFTFFREDDIDVWHKNVIGSFSMFGESLSLFGHDWQGNCFGIIQDEKKSDEVILFEVGTGEVLSMGCSFEDFINNEIRINSDACLASPFYEKWLKNGGSTSKYGRCIGYKVPLFMGGEDNITNLEESDMDVYWSVLSQLARKLESK